MLRWIPLILFSTSVLASDAMKRGQSDPIFSAYYTGWHAEDYPLSDVSWSKYTHVIYSVASTTPNASVVEVDVPDDTLLKQFVTLAHQNNVKASLSIGGWTASRWYSSNVGSAINRTTFVNTVTTLAKKYDLDGLDFDWEYPGMQGIGCNTVNPKDTANFLSFLQQLRTTTTGSKLIISVPVAAPFADASGSPSTNVSAFGDVLDYITVMNYDTGSNPSFGVGPNSPLDDLCAPVSGQRSSAARLVDAWSAAGMHLDQIVLGVPAYGYGYSVSKKLAFTSGSILAPYPAYNVSNTPPGDKWSGVGGIDVCGISEGPGGEYTYWGLMEEGFLNTDGTTKTGIAYRYDNCSQTPYMYNATSQVYVSFDNAQSFAAKGDFIHSKGLRGFSMWEAGGDYNDTLLDSIREATLTGGAYQSNTTASHSSASPTASSSAPDLHHNGGQWRSFFTVIALCAWICSR